jgi:hypothetical protein
MKIDLKQTEIAAICRALNSYYNEKILAEKILKKKPLSFEDEKVKEMKEFFEKNFGYSGI